MNVTGSEHARIAEATGACTGNVELVEGSFNVDHVHMYLKIRVDSNA